MAQSPLTSYQIVLIIILGLNLFFWVVVICWRIMLLEGVVNVTRRLLRSLETTLRRRPPPSNRDNSSLTSEANRHQTTLTVGEHSNDLPPSYEEAIKYPSISSLLSSSNLSRSSVAGICNHCSALSVITSSASSINGVPDMGHCSSDRGYSHVARTRSLSYNDLPTMTKREPDGSPV